MDKNRKMEINHHVNSGVSEVDEGRYHFTLASDLVECTRIPQRENGAYKLDKVLLPPPIWSGTAACMLSVSQATQALWGRLDVRESVS